MLGSRRLGYLLAIDAIGTILLGAFVYFRSERLVAIAANHPGLRVLADPDTARRAGIAVAVLGATKGLLYAAGFARFGGDTGADG